MSYDRSCRLAAAARFADCVLLDAGRKSQSRGSLGQAVRWASFGTDRSKAVHRLAEGRSKKAAAMTRARAPGLGRVSRALFCL